MSAYENVFPYIILLPMDLEKQTSILKNVFGSELGMKIFRKLGIDARIVQKDIIETLEGHSNKTIIQKLKSFEKLRLLESKYTKVNGRRLLCYYPTTIGRWVALLLSEVPKDSIGSVFEDLFQIYLDSSLRLALDQGFDLEQFHDIFHRIVARLSLQLIQKDIHAPKFTPEVIVFGSAAMDLLIRTEIPDIDELIVSEDIRRLPGGSAANVAVALSTLGIQASFMGKLGGDFNSLLLIKEFLREGVDISNLKIEMNKKTPEVVIINSNGDKRIIAPYGDDIAVSLETPEEIDWGVLESTKLIYIGELFREVAAVVSSYGHNFGKLVVYRPSTACMRQGIEIIEPILKNTDYFLMNKKGWELLRSSSNEKLRTANDLLDYGCSTIIITQGSHGCTVHQRERKFTVPAKKVDAVDTTAAGDAFAAGLIKGMLEKMDLYDAVRIALDYASHSVQYLGARGAYKTFNLLHEKK